MTKTEIVKALAEWEAGRGIGSRPVSFWRNHFGAWRKADLELFLAGVTNPDQQAGLAQRRSASQRNLDHSRALDRKRVAGRIR